MLEEFLNHLRQHASVETHDGINYKVVLDNICYSYNECAEIVDGILSTRHEDLIELRFEVTDDLGREYGSY